MGASRGDHAKPLHPRPPCAEIRRGKPVDDGSLQELVKERTAAKPGKARILQKCWISLNSVVEESERHGWEGSMGDYNGIPVRLLQHENHRERPLDWRWPPKCEYQGQGGQGAKCYRHSGVDNLRRVPIDDDESKRTGNCKPHDNDDSDAEYCAHLHRPTRLPVPG
jgi:hypothetical protein